MQGARWIAIGTLTLLAVSAIGGAIPLILHPEGSAFISISVLRHTPFRTFLIPGIVLLTANGLLACGVLWMVLRRHWHFGWLTAGEGAVLAGWLLIETIMMQAVVLLHVLYMALAVVMMVSGLALRREEHVVRKTG